MYCRWWWLIAAIGVLDVGVVWFVRERVQAQDALSRAERIAEALDSGRAARPAFGTRAENAENDAWHHYSLALGVAQGGIGSGVLATAALRAAAASTNAGFPDADVRDGFEMAAPDVLECLDFGRRMVGHARRRLQAGEVGESVRALIDTSVFGRDVAATGTTVGWCVGCIVMDEALAALAEAPLRSLSREAAWALEVELEQMEGIVPPISLPLQGEAAAVAFALLADCPAPALEVNSVLLTLFSGSAVARQQAYLEELIAASRLPWEQATQRAWDAWNDFRGSINPLTRMLGAPGLGANLHGARKVIARIRALREVLHHHGLGRRLELDDPFGDGALQFEVGDDGSLRCWSPGAPADESVSVRVR